MVSIKCFSLCRACKASVICEFYNNLEFVWDGMVKRNRCFRLDRKTEYFVSAGAADQVT